MNLRVSLPLAQAADQQSDSRPVHLISEQRDFGIAREISFYSWFFPRLIANISLVFHRHISTTHKAQDIVFIETQKVFCFSDSLTSGSRNFTFKF